MGDEAHSREIVPQLREAALDLPLQRVGKAAGRVKRGSDSGELERTAYRIAEQFHSAAAR